MCHENAEGSGVTQEGLLPLERIVFRPRSNMQRLATKLFQRLAFLGSTNRSSVQRECDFKTRQNTMVFSEISYSLA